MYLEDGVVYNIPNFINSKLIDMKKHIDDNLGITRIIVYRFTEDKRKLQEAFGNECTEDLKKFTSGQSKILLMQCQQGVGVNLQVADEIHFYTMDVSFVNYIQMIHRAWRKGRINDVNIFIWQYEGSVEEKIWASVKQKKAIGDLLFSIKSLL